MRKKDSQVDNPEVTPNVKDPTIHVEKAEIGKVND